MRFISRLASTLQYVPLVSTHLIIKAVLFGIVSVCMVFSGCSASSSAISDEASLVARPAVKPAWPAGFDVVDLVSESDSTIQKAYRYKSSQPNQPLVVVLHTWSSDYTQLLHSLAKETAARDWNYIHPDFRGSNTHPDACCSDKVIADIDAAIRYALHSTQANPEQVHILGASGGGYATLCHFMQGEQQASSYSAWVPISDLPAWYVESLGRGNKYAGEILSCTGSGNTLDMAAASSRSPIHMPVPIGKLQESTLNLFAGIHDGYTGSVPITHSLRFYNYLLDAHGISTDQWISDHDIEYLLRTRTSPDSILPADSLSSKPVLFQRSQRNVRLAIFEGGHEMVDEVALDQIRWHEQRPRVILAIGDSNGASEQGWVNQLQTLRPHDTILNFSRSGNTIGFDNLGRQDLNTLRQIGRYLNDAVVQANGRPIDEILINLGTNDSKAVFHTQQHDVSMNLLYLIHLIKRFPFNQTAPPRITIVSPPPYGPDEVLEPKYHGGADRVDLLTRSFKKLAKGSGSGFVDIHSLLKDDFDTLALDGVHMNEEGQLRIAQAIEAFLW